MLMPEIAFWGRSNVGKSSLINSLLNRKKLVKVSNTPGRTREINFFNLNEELYVVDLPGYGYARISQNKRALWNQVVVDYLIKGARLRRIYLLIDARVGFKEIDFEIMDFLNDIGKSYQIVFTKIDKSGVKNLQNLKEQATELAKKNPACFPEVLCSSSKDKQGIKDLQNSIIALFV
jgi:GTP-binding protein